MTDQEILDWLRSVLTEMFEIEPGRVQLDTNLFTDLELDSIDAVDLAIQLQNKTGKRVEPQNFKEIRLVSDVIAAVQRLLKA